MTNLHNAGSFSKKINGLRLVEKFEFWLAYDVTCKNEDQKNMTRAKNFESFKIFCACYLEYCDKLL